MKLSIKSNLNIRSNLYPIPDDFLCYITKASPKHGRFVKQIQDCSTFDKLPKQLAEYGTVFQINDFGVCSSHPNKEITYGPLLRSHGVVYGCRCDIKETCHNRKILSQREFRETGIKIDCKICPRFKE